MCSYIALRLGMHPLFDGSELNASVRVTHTPLLFSVAIQAEANAVDAQLVADAAKSASEKLVHINMSVCALLGEQCTA